MPPMTRQELKTLRDKLGLSVAQAAEQVHVSRRTWERYESGDRHVPEAIVHLFCVVNRIGYK